MIRTPRRAQPAAVFLFQPLTKQDQGVRASRPHIADAGQLLIQSSNVELCTRLNSKLISGRWELRIENSKLRIPLSASPPNEPP